MESSATPDETPLKTAHASKPKPPEQKDAEADMAWWPGKGYAHKALMRLRGYLDGSSTHAPLLLGKVCSEPHQLKYLLEDLDDLIASVTKFRAEVAKARLAALHGADDEGELYDCDDPEAEKPERMSGVGHA